MKKLARLGSYGFALMFVAIGIFVAICRPSDAPWYVGPLFMVVGLLIVVMQYVLHRSADGRAAILKGGIDGRGTVTAVKPTSRWEGNEVRYFRLSLSVEVPGRPAYAATALKTLHRSHFDAIQPGMVLPLRVSPTDPTKIMVVTDIANRPMPLS
jgi:hypothetical protein